MTEERLAAQIEEIEAARDRAWVTGRVYFQAPRVDYSGSLFSTAYGAFSKFSLFSFGVGMAAVLACLMVYYWYVTLAVLIGIGAFLFVRRRNRQD